MREDPIEPLVGNLRHPFGVCDIIHDPNVLLVDKGAGDRKG